MSLTAALVLHAAFAVLAIVGVQRRRPLLVMVGKPLATISLFAVAAFPSPSSATGVRWILLGLAASLIGDVALLGDGGRAFLIGLASFLLGHVAYAVGFVTGGSGTWAPAWGPRAVIALLLAPVVVGFTIWLLTRIVPRVGWGMRAPVVAYGVAIAAMTLAALSTVGGPWPARASTAAATGAVLFLASDANLAWNRFVAARPNGQSTTLALYWMGQTGIALAARWAV